MTTLQKQFLREKSFENYSDSSVLETMLTTADVGGDISQMVSNLFFKFGTLKGILEALPIQLKQTPQVTEKAAALIAMIAPLAKVWERCNMVTPTRITNRKELESYTKSLLMGERTERFYVISVNAQCNLLGAQKISEGSISEVSAYPRLVAEAALNHNAHSVFLAHTGGTCSPSTEDITSTIQLQRLLNSMDIMVLDHMIVAGSNTYSMAMHGDLEFGRRRAA